MATFVFTLDSVTKALTATKDGESISNVNSLCLYKYGDKYEMGLLQKAADANDGTTTWIQTSAAEEAYDQISQAQAETPAQRIARIYARRGQE